MTTPPSVFIPIAEAGAEAVAALMQQAFDPRFGEAWSAAQMADILKLDGVWGEVLVDPADGLPAAFTLCRFAADEAELLLIAVTPKKRSGGIGRMMTVRAAQAARAHGAHAMYLEVRDGNAAALGLYAALRFVQVGRRRNYYRGGDGEYFDAITMRMPID